jgi:hypothetical protein
VSRHIDEMLSRALGGKLARDERREHGRQSV